MTDESRKSNLVRPNSLIVHFEGKTYDIAPYVNIHPGGGEALRKNSGKDITEVLLNQPAHQPVLNFIRKKLATFESKEK